MKTLLVLLLAGVCGVCRTLSQEVLPADSVTWEMYARLGDACYSRGQLGQSLDCYRNALRLHVSDTLVQAVANCYYQRGYYRDCIRTFRQYQNRDSSEYALGLLARCYEKLECVDSALFCRKQIAARNMENSTNLTALAQMYLDGEQPDSALWYLDRYEAVDSTNLTVNRLKAYAHYLAGAYDTAAGIYKKLKQGGEEPVSTDYYLGLSYARLDSLSEAYSCLSEAVRRSERTNPHILSQRGIVGSQIGELDESTEDITEAIRLLQPDKELMAYLYETLGVNSIQLRKYSEAIPYYQKVLEYRPDRLRCYFQMAHLYGILKQPGQAKRYYERFVQEVKKCDEPERYAKLLEVAQDCLEDIKTEEFFRGENR